MNALTGDQLPDHYHKRDRIDPKDLFGGFKVYAATPTHEGKNGDIVLVNTGAARSICAYLAGTWYCSTLT